ncbi:flagellar biosynthesis regulator FlaF [Bradyrhizobium liaoningense]
MGKKSLSASNALGNVQGVIDVEFRCLGLCACCNDHRISSGHRGADPAQGRQQLQDAVNNADPLSEQTMQALMFNRKLWTIFLSEAMRDTNPQPIDVRQKIANISVFVLSQTAALQMSPQFDHFRPLIEINRNIAAGLSGRP